MDRLAALTIERGRLTILLLLAVVVGGTASFLTQPRQEDPEIVLRSSQVVTRFPGLSHERSEQLVTRPIEEAIKQIPEVDEISSISMSGLSIVSPTAAHRYDDMTLIWADLRNRMDDLEPTLPEGHQGIKVNDDYGRVAVITLALTGAEFEMRELREVAEDVRDQIGALPLVARVDLFGLQGERIVLEFDPQFMAQFGISPAAIISALQAQNVVLPGGSVSGDDFTVDIEPSGDFRSLDELRDFVIETPDGALVYLQDLATIRRGYVDPPSAPAYFNGEPAVVLGISMVESSNVVALGEQVNARLASIYPLLPVGMSLDVAIFQPDLVQASVAQATENLLQTMLVVLVVVMLFLGWRTGLVVGAMVPLTVLITLIVMSVTGIELHRISIAAIIVALGLLVDNGVVIAEDIRQRLDRGAERLDAVRATTRTLAVPLLTSSLTTVIAFLPLVLIEDTSGEFLRSLGQVLAIALLSSWLLAITVSPAFCYWFLEHRNSDLNAAAGNDEQGYALYRTLLERMLQHRILFVLAMIGLLMLSLAALGTVKQRSLGPSERNQFTIYVDLSSEAPIETTIAETHRLMDYLRDESANPEVTDVLGYVGAGGPRFFLALSPNDPQPNKAFLVVNTRTPSDIDAVMARVETFIARDMPLSTGRAEILFLGNSAPGTVQIRIRGPDDDVLLDAADRIEQAFEAVSGIRAVRNDWGNPVVKLLVDVDQERARRAGVTSSEIAQSLSAYFDGARVTDFREGDTVIPVIMRAQASERDDLDTLRTVGVFSASRGHSVPLLQVADFRGEVEPSQIRRFNQTRAITVAASHPAMTAFELYSMVEAAINGLALPRGYIIELEGEASDAQESNNKLLGFAPHALFLIVLLLVMQFNSFRRPAIILLTIPLVLIGASFGLAIFDAYFDFAAMLGLFSLAGIIINNGIVLIARIDEQRAKGNAVNDAITSAAVARARPIIMTTLTTIVGLAPLALFGGEFWYGMAIVIMCGLGVGTILTLGFVPVVYSLFFSGFGGPGRTEMNGEKSPASLRPGC